MIDEQSQKRGDLLEVSLNRVFEVNNVQISQPFEQTEQNHQDSAKHHIEGIIDMAGYSYLVEMVWMNKPVDVLEISLHLVQIFNRDLSGGFLNN